MKIGIDVRLWNETGVGRYIRNLVENLYEIDRKNEYVLFCLKKDFEYISSNFLGWKVITASIRWHSIGEQKNLPRIIEKENLDLVHFPYFSVPVSYKRPFVVTMHDVIVNSLSTGRASTLPFPFYFAKRIAYKFIVGKALKNAVSVIVPCNSVKDDVLKSYGLNPKKIHVTYEGSSIFPKSKDKTLLKELSIEPKKYFLYVGNAYPHKNLERLLDAFLMFTSANPEIKLILAGKKDFFYERIENYPSVVALNGSIRFAFSPTDAELSLLYSNSLAFISPSLMEGFALPALEAMSLGTPLVLSDVPTFREICRDIPIAYFNPEDPIGIRHALDVFLNTSSKTVSDRIKLGKVLAKSYSWRKMAEETLRIYTDNSWRA